MSEEQNTVPYDQTPLSHKGLGLGGLQATLRSGATVAVVSMANHPHTGGMAVNHEYQSNQPDGTRSQLRFCLTPEAATVTAAMYVALGVVSLQDIGLLAAAMLSGEQEQDATT